MDIPRCSTCPYWASHGLHPAAGAFEDDFLDECRRHPPRPASPVDRDRGDWQAEAPLVAPGYFCGEHPDFPAYLARRVK